MAQNVTLERTDVNAPREILHVDTGPDRNAPEMAFVQPNPPPPQAPPQQAPARPLPPPPPQRPPQRPPQPQPQPQPQPEELSHFANQNKIEESPELADEFLDEDDGGTLMEEEYGNGQEEEEYGNGGGNGGSGGYYGHSEPPPAPAPVRPLPPFETLEDERADLMFKLQRAARAGIQVRTFGYSADIRDMRSEVARAKAEQDVTASIAFQRQILMTLCSGIEFANRKFSYFDLELDGWAESMMDDMGKFDNIFEKLHQKHAGRMNIPPEMQLVLAIGGSAMTWHLVKTMTKGAAGKAKRPKQVQSSSSEDSSRQLNQSRRVHRSAGPPPPKRTRDKPHPRQQQQPGPREMRGPGFDMGGMGDMMGPMMSMLPRVPIEGMPAPPMHSRPNKRIAGSSRSKSRITEIESSAAGSSSDNDNDNDGHSGHSGHSVSSERLSDIPSEFSADVPSEFSDVPRSSRKPQARDDDDVLDIDIPPPTKRKRGPNKKNAGPPKTIVVI